MVSSGSRPLISVVVPCYNEADCIPAFHARLLHAVKELSADFEVIYVDDGSRDGTFSLVAALKKGGSNIGVIKLSRNFGKESAMLAGLLHARGDAAVLIDADLQDPPEPTP